MSRPPHAATSHDSHNLQITNPAAGSQAIERHNYAPNTPDMSTLASAVGGPY
jgi:hypothetical protein